MPANTSSFSKSQPSGASLIRLGDDLLRSDKSILEATLNEEHYFAPQDSTSSASGGVHRLGSARAFSAVSSQLSNSVHSGANAVGRLFFNTDTGSLHVLHTSSHSTLVGGTQPIGAIAIANGAGSQFAIATSSVLTFDATLGGLTTSYGTSSTTAFAVPSGYSGIHRIDLNAVFVDGTQAEVAAHILINGSKAARGSALTKTTGSHLDSRRRVFASWTGRLSEGAVISAVAEVSSAASMRADGTALDNTFITIMRL